jgi:hypothetical protein
MVDADIQRVLGKLEAGIDNMADQQRIFRAEQRADNKLIFDKLENIAANGCALGARHAADIKKLQEQPARAVSIGAAIASIIAMVSAILATWRGN